jgi:hypothetical protein
MIKRYLTKLAVKQSLKNSSIIQVDNTKYLEDTLKKMLPKIVKKDNDWYQDGSLYIRFFNDFIQIKTASEYSGKTITITNNEDSLFLYLNYLKSFTHDGKVNKPSEGKGAKQECPNTRKVDINGIVCKKDKKCKSCRDIETSGHRE